jgi:hypothetical protein
MSSPRKRGSIFRRAPVRSGPRYQSFQWVRFAAVPLARGVSAPSQHAAEKQPSSVGPSVPNQSPHRAPIAPGICDWPRTSSPPCLSLLAPSLSCASVPGMQRIPLWRRAGRIGRLRLTRCELRPPPPPTINHPATSLGPRCAIATRPSANFFQKPKSDLTGSSSQRLCGLSQASPPSHDPKLQQAVCALMRRQSLKESRPKKCPMFPYGRNRFRRKRVRWSAVVSLPSGSIP